jgi:predicted DNA-binding WGR domain protein
VTAVLLTRIDPAENMARFYKLDVQPTLFGEWALVREWGRIGRGGQWRSDPYPTRGTADLALVTLMGIKTRKGYRSHCHIPERFHG